MLEVPPIKTWADITDQKVGTSAISNAPTASATIPAVIKRAFGSQVIDQRARRRLRENSCDPADRKREPDALFVPSIASEVNRDERPHPRLHVGEEEIEPIESTQRPPGRGRLGLHEGVRIARTLH